MHENKNDPFILDFMNNLPKEDNSNSLISIIFHDKSLFEELNLIVSSVEFV